MKTLYLVRHAKSSWKYRDLDDFDRPLNKRGERDAPAMGQFLKGKTIIPDIIISSPAIRASMTTRILSNFLSYPFKKVQFSEDIYEADISSLFKVLSRVDDKFASVMMVGHNPGMTYFANVLVNARIDNIPTCGVVCSDLDISSWQDISEKCGTMKFFRFPKNL